MLVCEGKPNEYFYPRPPRGGRQNTFLGKASKRRISIHALREEGDVWAVDSDSGRTGFLSTPSARRATRYWRTSASRQFYFYPRPPRGGRQGRYDYYWPVLAFLSTPSARRATREHFGVISPDSHFYPRPPRGGRQQKQRQNLYFQTNYTTFCTNLEEP